MARSHCCAIFGDCIRTMPISVARTIGTGLFTTRVAQKPAAINPNRISSATTLVRGRATASVSDPRRTRRCTGTIGLSFSLPRAMRVDFGDDFVEREAGGVGVGEHAGDERFQTALMLGGGPRPLRSCA